MSKYKNQIGWTENNFSPASTEELNELYGVKKTVEKEKEKEKEPKNFLSFLRISKMSEKQFDNMSRSQIGQ